ncbi:hypothetical protein MSBR3_1375 [Methanosarcina barkeri 3]|uniref:Uncharacterized protein n=1 Tax=Methanosarcina barkeri 3 TaxID=1434107 RepID=A0A0E3SM73_METBA|nr:hypothetical protein [Methanosarcina barkeri]AKB81953.1 hypothetical protein MSBR3_1375 [Methanosarcina barkeri 3]
MTKPGIMKPVLLLVLIGIIVTAFVQPIAGSTMGQGKLMEQKDKMVPCPENKSMMQSGTKECENSEMYETSSKEKMKSMMEEKSCNETMTGSMMKEKLANKSCYNESLSKANIDCAHLWLKKAIKIHEMHMMNPCTSTEDSNMEMMDQMKEAKKYLAGEKMNMDMMGRAEDNKSVEYKHPYVISALMRLDCCDFWLDETIKLHEMHMKDPKTATNESQMRLMANMMRANRYLAEEDMDMGMVKNASLSQDNVDFTALWLEKAIKLHAMYLKAPETATNESHMRLMNQMMRARECMEGKGMNLEMMMDFEEDSAREMYEPSSREMCEPSPREKMIIMMMGSMKMGEKSLNKTMMKAMKNSIMEDKLAKKDKMERMMEEKEANESCYTDKMDKKVSLTQADLDCVCLCLEKAIKMHEMCLMKPEAATGEFKMEMMKEMMQAHEYLTGEKMDMDIMDKEIDNESTCDNESAGPLKEKIDYLSSKKGEDCSSSKMDNDSSSGQCKNYSSNGC